MSSIIFGKNKFFCDEQQCGADDGGGDGVGDGGGESLGEDEIHGLAIQHDLQHRGDACPADDVNGNLDQVEPDQILPLQLPGGDAGDICQNAGDRAENSRGDDPAPAGRAVGQVDGDVPQQSCQSA